MNPRDDLYHEVNTDTEWMKATSGHVRGLIGGANGVNGFTSGLIGLHQTTAQRVGQRLAARGFLVVRR